MTRKLRHEAVGRRHVQLAALPPLRREKTNAVQRPSWYRCRNVKRTSKLIPPVVLRGALLLVLALLAACVGANDGVRIHFATASPEALAAAEKEPVVWYEFKPGDELPVMFGFIGMAEMGSDELPLVVKRPFWIVAFEDGRTSFSFDGKTLISNPFSRWGMLLGTGEERGKMAVIMYVGPANEAPEQLK